jgi:hypothetical protein
MTPKNIALEPELLEQVGKLAQEEGKSHVRRNRS